MSDTRYKRYNKFIRSSLFNNKHCVIKRADNLEIQAPLDKDGLNIPNIKLKHLATLVMTIYDIIIRRSESPIAGIWRYFINLKEFSPVKLGNKVTKSKTINYFLKALKTYNSLTNNILLNFHPTDITLKFLYKCIFYTQHSVITHISPSVWKSINKTTYPQIKSAIWKFLKELFPIYPTSTCPWCDSSDSFLHTFFLCNNTKYLLKEPNVRGWSRGKLHSSYFRFSVAIIARIIWISRATRNTKSRSRIQKNF